MKKWLLLTAVLAFAVLVQSNAENGDEDSSSIPLIDDETVSIEVASAPVSLGSGIFDDIFTVDVEGKFFWKRIYYIDNLNNSSPYKETRTVKKSITTSYSELTQSVREEARKGGFSAEASIPIDIIKVGVKESLDLSVTSTYKSVIEKKSESTFSEEIKREFSVGANSVGEMFQLIYNGPGVAYALDIVSTDGSLPIEKVFITCTARRVPMIKNIDVVHTSESILRPEDLIRETDGQNPDINKGFRGKYVWLVPVWTNDKDEAVTGIQVATQRGRNDDFKDMAAGARGLYRYLKMLKDPSISQRIRKVGLLRSPKATYIYPRRHEYGWDECTTDINEDRKGDWLHLCWNTVSL